MSSIPLVSVIIPTYNRAMFLPAAIQSILDQTYPNVEIVLVDDGSTDETEAVLKPFMSKIKYITTEHKGAAHARNTGMKAAAGKYIAFLDSDDTYRQYKLELQVDFMEEHPEVGMVYTEFSGKFENGNLNELNMRNYHDIYNRKGWAYEDIFPIKGEFSCCALDKPVDYYIGNIFNYTLMDTFVTTNTVLFQKKILETVGFQNESYRFAQEYEFVVRICKYYQVAFLNISTYVIFLHEKAATSFSANDHSRSKEINLLKIEQYMVFLNTVLDWGYEDKEYYNRNREFINMRLAELYGAIGFMHLTYGNSKTGREFLKRCYSFDKAKKGRLKYLLLSFAPDIILQPILKYAHVLSASKEKS